MHIPDFESIENFRDIAAYPCRYGKMKKGVVYRSASPYYGTAEDISKLRALGIQSVIDLRGKHFNEECPSPFLNDREINYFRMDIPNGDTWPDYEEEIPECYLNYIRDPYFMRGLLHAVVYAPKPLLIHCEAGKDRTGVLCGLLMLLNGVSKKDVVREYNISYHDQLPKTEQRTLEFRPSLPHFVFHMNKKTFARFVDLFFERYGTLEDYLDCISLGEGESNAVMNLFGTQETSAGAVVFHEEKVLVEHMTRGHYSMPKGHVEPLDEDLYATAHREINEETGLSVDIDPDFVTYSVYSPREGRIKRVHWFIAHAKSAETTCQIEEVSECFWLSPADAMRVLTHEDDRRILSEVCAYQKSKK